MLSGVHEFQYLGKFVIGIAIAVGLYLLVKYILKKTQKNIEPKNNITFNYEEDRIERYMPNKTKEPSPTESTWGCILTVIAVIVGFLLFGLALSWKDFPSIVGIIVFASITLFFAYGLYKDFMDN